MVSTENRRVGYRQLVSFATVLTAAVDQRHRAALSFSALNLNHCSQRHPIRHGRTTSTRMVPRSRSSSLDFAATSSTGCGVATRGDLVSPALAKGTSAQDEVTSVAFALVEEDGLAMARQHRRRLRQEERRRMQRLRQRRRQIRRAAEAARREESSSSPLSPNDGNGWALGWPGTILRLNRRRLAEATAAAENMEQSQQRRMSPRPPPPLSPAPLADEARRQVREDRGSTEGGVVRLGGRPPFLGGMGRQRRGVGERIQEEEEGAAAAQMNPSPSADHDTDGGGTGATTSKGNEAVSSPPRLPSKRQRSNNRPRRRRNDRTNARQRRRYRRRPPRREASLGMDGDVQASFATREDLGAQSLQDGAASVAVAAIATVDQTQQVQEDESITASPPDDAQGEGRRISFSAAREATRSLKSLDEGIAALLTPYMTQPVEQYSLLAFHDDDEASTLHGSVHDRGSGHGADHHGGEEEDSSFSEDEERQSKSRRWIVRRLNEDEAAFYHRDGDEGGDHVPDNFFRLAVPLMPLIGLDLTPVIDLEVVVNATSCNAHGVDDDGAASHESGHRGRRWRPRRWRRRQTEDEITIRSLRVALLSTEDEVQNAMGNNNNSAGPGDKGGDEQPSDATEGGAAISATARESVQKIGYEAIGMAGRLEGWFRPHLSFDATINWVEGDVSQREDSFIKVTASATTSLTIPDLPVPIPSRLILKRLGSMLTGRALSLALPQFLRQLERDFRRWASVDDAKQSEGVKVLVSEEGGRVC